MNYLIQKGLDIDAVDEYNYTALFFADGKKDNIQLFTERILLDYLRYIR